MDEFENESTGCGRVRMILSAAFSTSLTLSVHYSLCFDTVFPPVYSITRLYWLLCVCVLLQYVWDRMLGGFKHKNNRTREGVCLCLIATLNTWVPPLRSHFSLTGSRTWLTYTYIYPRLESANDLGLPEICLYSSTVYSDAPDRMLVTSGKIWIYFPRPTRKEPIKTFRNWKDFVTFKTGQSDSFTASW